MLFLLSFPGWNASTRGRSELDETEQNTIPLKHVEPWNELNQTVYNRLPAKRLELECSGTSTE